MNIALFRKNDILLYALIIIIASFSAFAAFAPDGDTVGIVLNGEIYNVSLDIDRVIEIPDAGRIIIEAGTVRMEDADCPDKLCVKQGRISRAGQSIICLPNRLVIIIYGESEWDIIV